jgi:hypothetical protein
MGLGSLKFRDITCLDYKDPRNFVWYRTEESFILPINVFDPQRENTPSVKLESDDVFGMARIKFQTGVDTFEFSSVVLFGDRLHPVYGSKDFFTVNPKLFVDITKSYLRSVKLDKILG